LAVITVRIPKEIRKRMRRLKAVNWSAVVRDAIEARLDLEEGALERDWERVRRRDRSRTRCFMKCAGATDTSTSTARRLSAIGEPEELAVSYRAFLASDRLKLVRKSTVLWQRQSK
jgi:hypothetical protein